MPMTFQHIYNSLTYDLEFFLTVNLDRTYWENHNSIKPRDIEICYEIVEEAFGDDTEPDIQYMVKTALYCTLMRDFPYDEESPYACEKVYELAIRNVQEVLNDYRDRLETVNFLQQGDS
jgi:hypothetical protein